MSTLQDAENLVASLTREEKAQLLQHILTHLGDAPGIEAISDVCGGEPVIIRTRIPVWTLEQARRLGMNDAELLRAYPSLRADDLTNAWNYVRTHRDQIEQQIRDNEAA